MNHWGTLGYGKQPFIFASDIRNEGHIHVPVSPGAISRGFSRWADNRLRKTANCSAWTSHSLGSDDPFTTSHYTFQYRQGPSINLPCVVNCPICKSFSQELFSYLNIFLPSGSSRTPRGVKMLCVLYSTVAPTIPLPILLWAPKGWPLRPAWQNPWFSGFWVATVSMRDSRKGEHFILLP